MANSWGGVHPRSFEQLSTEAIKYRALLRNDVGAIATREKRVHYLVSKQSKIPLRNEVGHKKDNRKLFRSSCSVQSGRFTKTKSRRIFFLRPARAADTFSFVCLQC